MALAAINDGDYDAALSMLEELGDYEDSVSLAADCRWYKAAAALDGKNVKLSVTLPALISMDSDVNTPRLPSYKIKKQLKEGDIKFFTFDDFDDKDPNHYGLSGSATQVERIFPPEKNTQKHIISGDANAQTDELYQLLRAKKLV